MNPPIRPPLTIPNDTDIGGAGPIHGWDADVMCINNRWWYWFQEDAWHLAESEKHARMCADLARPA
jgi:hypothetical protein